MPKKKTTRTARKNTSFLETHNNLKWLVPLLIIVLLGTAFIINYRMSNENVVNNSAFLKQEIRQTSPIHRDTVGPSTTPTQTGY